MSAVGLNGDTLGEKHKYFNKLVQDAVQNKQFNITTVNNGESDLDNLFKIDAAGKTKNVDFIISVLKCDDMLYVSRAIKQSTWLITEQEYAHIISPEYLHTQLFPYMLTKAINKLLLQIRVHLKDEQRAEAFYNYLKDISKEAPKWLLICSVPFVENLLHNEGLIMSLPLFKRLCKRSSTFLKYYKRIENQRDGRALNAVPFVIKSKTGEYLNFMESLNKYISVTFGKKHTEIIMKKYPDRILDNFEKYMNNIDLGVVARYMKKGQVKDFLYKSVKTESVKCFLSNYDNLCHFINRMPDTERFEFVKKTYITKVQPAPGALEMFCREGSTCFHLTSRSVNTSRWYEYAPINVAFAELTKLIETESSASERSDMLSVLIKCANNNPQYTKILLEHYFQKHRDEPIKYKIQFVNNLIIQTPTHEFDNETWNILNNLFQSMEVYNECGKELQLCFKSIIIYYVLNGIKVPYTVEKKLAFSTFKDFQSKLSKEQQHKIFSYLLSSITAKIQNKRIVTESDFTSAIRLVKYAFKLLLDWKKDIKDYAFLIHKIQELTKINKQNTWNIKLAPLYNMNKSWRRHMFEESVTLYPCEEVCLNALKHKPGLLAHYNDEVEALRTNDNISLKRLLAKLRVYWPYSLAQQWTAAYLNNISNNSGHKAVIEGLCVLLPQEQIVHLAKRYVPPNSKIDWHKVDQRSHSAEFIEFSLRKNIAKRLHIARPLASLEAVLWYAKGDYLQYAAPSLSAIIHNISKVQSYRYVPQLLDAPVSIQKYGVDLAFMKLQYHELKPIFTNIWSATKNSTIRTRLFTYTYNLLCKVKEPAVATELWELLSMFIDNLTPDENMLIFSMLGNPSKIHSCVRGMFFMKSYVYFMSLPARVNCRTHKSNLLHYAPNIIELLDPVFVTDNLFAEMEEKIGTRNCEYIDIISSYVLHGRTEEEQCERYRRTLEPALGHAFRTWHIMKDYEYVTRNNVDTLFKSLTWDFRRFTCKKTIVVPVELFFIIKRFMEENITVEDNYERYSTWKLTTEYVKLVAENIDMLQNTKLDSLPPSDFDKTWLPDDAEEAWEALHIKISPKFGQIIVKILKEDIQKLSPTIFWLFSYALGTLFTNLSMRNNLMKLVTLKDMLFDVNFIPSYLVVCDEIPEYGNDDERKKGLEIHELVSLHPSKEVQSHYQSVFDDVSE